MDFRENFRLDFAYLTPLPFEICTIQNFTFGETCCVLVIGSLSRVRFLSALELEIPLEDLWRGVIGL